MKIAIIGGGWVGCHLAYKFRIKHNVTIFEKNDTLFQETSFKNQNRLHLGYHYARNFKTRTLCLNTFSDFLSDYEFLTKKVPNNIYCVPNSTSIIDFETYKKIFGGFEFNEIHHVFKNVEGCISTGERYINFDLAQSFFNTHLKDIHVKRKITQTKINSLKKDFDLVINATNNHIKDKSNNSFYELTISLVYENMGNLDFGALTMVDGNLFSIYPYHDNMFTLTDVDHTPIKKFNSIVKLEKYKSNINEGFVNQKRELIEKKVLKYYPNFKKNFKYNSYFISTKSKIISESDERYPVISNDGNLINCFTGKIQGIYIIEDYINNEINNMLNGK